MDWFRWHHGTVTDPKWRVIARRSGQSISDVIAVFAAMLERASQADERGVITGWDDEDIGALLDMDPAGVRAVREAMQGKVLDGESLSGWSKRQPKRERPDDDSSGRVRAFRERSNGGNATDCDATPRNATKRLEEIRGEESSSDPNGSGAHAPMPVPANAEDPIKALFDTGVKIITASGRSDREARSIIGQLRKAMNDSRAAGVLAEAGRATEPVEFIQGAIRQAQAPPKSRITPLGVGG